MGLYDFSLFIKFKTNGYNILQISASNVMPNIELIIPIITQPIYTILNGSFLYNSFIKYIIFMINNIK